LISALTLPAIFNSVDQNRKKALFKETATTLQNILSDEYMNGNRMLTQADIDKVFTTKLGSTKVCPPSSTDKACQFWINGSRALFSWNMYILPTGVTLVAGRLQWSLTNTEYQPTIWVDVDGSLSGTNGVGDQVGFVFNSLENDQHKLDKFSTYLPEGPPQPGQLTMYGGTDIPASQGIKKML
jgi:hypothetical protein